MKKINWAAMLLIALLILSGCQKTDPGTLTYETVFEKTSASMKEGHLFFAGKVLEKRVETTPITFYDSEAEANTFYTVQVTDDFFDLLPDRKFTVCVMGTPDQFTNRTDLEKNGIYLFDCSVWMQEDELILLLPTFHNALPRREGKYLSYTENGTRYGVEGTYEDYKEHLKKMAADHGYGAGMAMDHIRDRLTLATQKDVAYFENLGFESIDTALVKATSDAADTRLLAGAGVASTAEGVKELLK